MTDLAELGLSIHSEQVPVANERLDDFAEKATRAEKSSDALAAGNSRAMAAVLKHLASIERMLGGLNQVTQAQQAAAGSSAALAKAQSDAAAAADRASKAERQLATVQQGQAAAAKSAADANRGLAVAHSAYAGTAARTNATFVQGAAGAKLQTHEMLNLSRQFSDIAVTAAMGMNPLMIFIQQVPQIADVFQTASARGIGFAAVLRQIGVAAGAALAPLLPIILPIVAVVTVAAAGFALLHRELSKTYPKDITDGLNLTSEQMKRVRNEAGLTEEQIKHLKNTTVTFGDTFVATFVVIGRHIMSGPIGDGLKWLGARFGETMDWIAKTALGSAANIVGAFVGAYEGIKATWKQLPAVIGDVVVSSANLVLRTLAEMVNGAISKLNTLIAVANAAARGAGLSQQLQGFAQVTAPQLDNPNAGAAKRAGEDFGKAAGAGFSKGASDFLKSAKNLGGEIAAEALARAQRRVLRAAGDPNKTPKGAAAPRDQTDERIAEIQAALAAAKAEELQAQLAVTKEVKARAVLEKLIAAQQMAVKIAQVDRQIANIQDDKGLSDATKAQLIAQLEIIKVIQGRIGVLKEQAIDEATSAALAKEALALQLGARESQIAVLQSQYDASQFEFQRKPIALSILKLQQQMEKLKLEEVVASAASTQNEKAIAAARLGVLDQIHANQMQAAVGGFMDAFESAQGGLDSMASAFKSKNWTGVIKGLDSAIASLKTAFGPGGTIGGKIGAVAGIANSIGGMIGGSAGNLISGAAGGAMAGFSVGGPVGAAIGGVVGFIGGLFGNSAKKKQAEANRLAAIANQKRQIEIQLLEASGDAVGALAARRKDELAAMDDSNKALAQQLYAAQDAAEAAQKAKDLLDQRTTLDIAYMRAIGDETGALAAERKQELEALDPALKAVKQMIWAREDEAAAAAKAADLAQQRRSIEIAILDATGDALGATTARRQDELAALDASLRTLQSVVYAAQDLKAANDNLAAANDAVATAAQNLADLQAQAAERAAQAVVDQLQAVADATSATAQQMADALATASQGVTDARSALTEAYERERAPLLRAAEAVTAAQGALRDAYKTAASGLQDTISKLGGLAASLRKFRDSLTVSSATPADAYAVARANFIDTSVRARGGDQTALGDLQGVSEAFLEASKANASSTLDVARDLALVRNGVDASAAAAQAGADTAQQQLDVLTTQVSALVDINDSVLSVQDAIDKLNAAVASNVTAQAQLAALDASVQGLIDVNGSVLTVGQALANLAAATGAQADAQAASVAAQAAYAAAALAAEQAQTALQSQQLQATVASQALAMANAEAALSAAQASQQQAQASASTAAAALAIAQSLAAAQPAPTPAPAPTVSPVQSLLPDWDAYLNLYTDVRADYMRNAALYAAQGETIADFAYRHYREHGRAEGRRGVVGYFAKGGIFNGGIVSQPTTFNMGMMGEGGRPEAIMPLVRGPDGLGVRAANDDGWREVVAELRALRSENAQQRADIKSMARDLDHLESMFTSVTEGGRAMQTEEAA